MPEPCRVSADDDYLSDLSPKDKPWDVHKAQAVKVRALYSGSFFDRLSDRMGNCGGLLEFGVESDPETGESAFKLKSCRFCRCRHCPICQWRRSLMWTARFMKALPQIVGDRPNARYIFLTLTVKNCPIEELRANIQEMNKAWKRMALRKQWPAIGFIRSLEVTRSETDEAHPHFHALLMVPTTYFKGTSYLSQEKWSQYWQECLRVNYQPIVNVKAVHPNKKRFIDGLNIDPKLNAICAAIVETTKYSVKPEDLLGNGNEKDKRWLEELTSQLHRTRAVSLGGVFKQYLSEKEPEDLISDEEEQIFSTDFSLLFGWREWLLRYVRVEA